MSRLFDDPQTLLAETRSLRALARSLVGDQHSAEDLVQSTWVAALRGRPPARAPGRWLRGVLRNLFRQEQRSSRRRTRREHQAAEPEVQPDSVRNVEHLEILQAVVEAVRGLREPYRDTVLARYFRDETPQEMSRRLSVPVTTIHTRTHRAIGMLRNALDQRFAGDRSWRHGLVLLTSKSLLEQAGSAAAVGGTATIALAGSLMTKKLLAIGLVGSVALLGFWQLSPNSAEAQPPVQTTQGRAMQFMAGADEVPSLQESAPGEREALRQAAPGQPRYTIRVVDADTGHPVPGADVLGASDRSLAYHSDERFLSDLERLFETLGKRFVADAAGEVKIHGAIPSAPYQVRLDRFFLGDPEETWIARHGDRYGEGLIRDIEEGVLRIELERDLSLHVFVVDPGGKPAEGATVALEAKATDVALADERWWTSVTDASGHIEIRHMQRRVVSPSQKARVGLRLPGIDLPFASVDVLAPPSNPIRFQLPATGAIQVSVRGAGKRLLPVDGNLHLLLAGERIGSTPVEDGLASFPHVALGLDVGLVLEFPGPTRSSAHLRGPRRHAEVVSYEFDLSDDVLVSGRVSDVARKPLVRSSLNFTFSFGTEVIERLGVTDEVGDFAFLVEAEQVGQRLDGVTVRPYQGLSNEHAGMIGQVAVDNSFEGLVDLGELRLEDQPLLASGSFAKEIANIVARAGVADDAPILAVRTLGGGRFEIRGQTSSETIALELWTARGIASAACAVGDRDVALQVVATGELSAQIAHAGDSPLRINLALVPESGAAARHASSLFPQKTELGTRITWNALEPGRYQLVGRVIGAERPFVRIDGIDVKEGSNQDPRLENLSLDEFEFVQLEFVDPAGNPIERQLEGLAFTRRSEQHWEAVTVFSFEHRPMLTVPSGGADLRICIAGYEPVMVYGARGETLVRLRSENRIEVPFLFEYGGARDTVEVRAVPAPSEPVHYTFADGSSDGIDENGVARWTEVALGTRVTVGVPGAGSYDLVVRRPRPGGGHEQLSPSPQRFTVPAKGIAQVILVKL